MDYFIRSLDVLIFLSIPQSLIILWFVMMFWGIQVHGLRQRFVWFAVLHSIYLDIAFLALPSHIHIINSILSFIILLHIFFKELELKTKLLIAASCYIIVFLTDMLIYLSLSPFVDVNLILEGNTLHKILFTWPFFAVIAGLSFVLHRRKYYPAAKIRAFILSAKESSILYFILLITVQAMTLSVYFFARFYKEYDRILSLLFYLGLLTTVIVSFYAVRLIIKSREQAIQMTQQAYVGDLLQMLHSIRGQRHDFLNHLQVMSSMLKMKKYEQLKKYIDDVAVDIGALSDSGNHLPVTAITALVQSKLTLAMDRSIQFQYFLPDALNSLGKIKNIDLVRIVGNLIDNAFDEAARQPIAQRSVKLVMSLEEQRLKICVANPGQPLTLEQKRMIFTAGYTTKDGEHSGLGLSIVRDIVNRYEGSIAVEHDQGSIQFIASLPVR